MELTHDTFQRLLLEVPRAGIEPSFHTPLVAVATSDRWDSVDGSCV